MTTNKFYDLTLLIYSLGLAHQKTKKLKCKCKKFYGDICNTPRCLCRKKIQIRDYTPLELHKCCGGKHV